MSIRRKLFLIAIISLISLLAVGMSGYYFTNQVATLSNNLLEEEAIPILKIKEVEQATQEVMLATLVHLGSSDPALLSELEQRAMIAVTRVMTAIDQHDEIEKKHVEHIDATQSFIEVWKKFLLVQSSALEDSKSFLKEDALNNLLTKGKPLHDQAMAHIADMVDTHYNTMNTLRDQANLSRSHVAVLIVSFTFFALFIVMTALFLVSRSITRSVDRISRTVEETVGDGNFSRRFAGQNRDEMGKAMSSFDFLMDKLQTAIHEVNQVAFSLSEGDFSCQIKVDLEGDLGNLKNHINDSVSHIRETMETFSMVMGELAEGRFDSHIPVMDAKGDFKQHIEMLMITMTTLSQTIVDIKNVMQAMAACDLQQRIHVAAKGDLALLKENINDSMDILGETIAAIRGDSQHVAVGTSEITNAVEQLAREAHEQLLTTQKVEEALQMVRKNIQDVNREAEMATTNARHAAEGIVISQENMKRVISSAGENAKAAVDRVIHSRQKMVELVALVHDMAVKSQAIWQFTDRIGEIAERTTMLALNARIQASKAGQYGQGFAVIADDVRMLARNTSSLVVDIRSMIEVELQLVHTGEQAVDAILSELEQSSELVKNTDQRVQSLVEVNNDMEQVSQMVVQTDQILHTMMQTMLGQNISLENASKQLDSLGMIGRNNAATAEEMTATMASLARIALMTQEKVAKFKL